MVRLTNYGLWVDDDGNLDKNEIAIDYILDCAKSVGIKIEYGKTALDMQFMAEVMKRLRGTHMTKNKAIEVLKIVDENASCDDCLYYGQMEDCPNDENCIIREAIEMAIDELKSQKWILTDERLPENDQKVLVTCATNNRVWEAQWNEQHGRFYHDEIRFTTVEDTKAWMPMIPPYVGENE